MKCYSKEVLLTCSLKKLYHLFPTVPQMRSIKQYYSESFDELILSSYWKNWFLLNFFSIPIYLQSRKYFIIVKFDQGSFISKMEWAPFNCLFWKANHSILKLMTSISSGVSWWYRPCYKNIWNYDKTKNAENLR